MTNGSGVYKWIAGSLLTVVFLLAGWGYADMRSDATEIKYELKQVKQATTDKIVSLEKYMERSQIMDSLILSELQEIKEAIR